MNSTLFKINSYYLNTKLYNAILSFVLIHYIHNIKIFCDTQDLPETETNKFLTIKLQKKKKILDHLKEFYKLISFVYFIYHLKVGDALLKRA